MRLMTRARYTLARWALKGMSWSVTPTWVSRSILSAAFNSLVHEGARRNAAVYACLSTLAFSFPEAPLYVYPDDDEGSAPLPDHPLRRLIARPTMQMGESEFKALCILWMGIGGNCYVYKLRNARNQVIGLVPYHDGVMRPVEGEDDTWVSHYLFRQRDGTEVRVEPDDVIHLKWPVADPLAPWKAQPPILAAAREVDADNEASRYISALLQNDATPRTILQQSPQMALTDPEKERMRAEWGSLHGGERRGGVAILEAGVTVQRLALNMAELDFAALHQIPEKRICAALRVPPSVAGLGDDPTYANSAEAWERYTRGTLVPLWRAYESAMQAGLSGEFGGVTLRHHLGRVAALQEDENAKWARVSAAFAGGLLGWQESRALIGITTPPDRADLFAVQLSRDLLPFAQLIAPPAPTVTVLPEPAPAQLEAPEQRARPGVEAKARGERLGRALRRVRLDAARRAEPRIEAAFTALADTVVARAEAAKGRKALPALDDLFPDGDFLDLATVFRAATLDVLRASWELWNQALDVEIEFAQSDPAVVAALAQSSSRIRGITETTRDAVRALLQFGASEGWSIDQLVRGTDERPGLRAVVEETYRNRARAIARTEVGTAQNVATHARYAAAGVRRVTILDNGVEDSDPVCAALNGTTQTLEWFRANPLQHPNCLRAAAPAFDDE